MQTKGNRDLFMDSRRPFPRELSEPGDSRFVANTESGRLASLNVTVMTQGRTTPE